MISSLLNLIATTARPIEVVSPFPVTRVIGGNNQAIVEVLQNGKKCIYTLNQASGKYSLKNLGMSGENVVGVSDDGSLITYRSGIVLSSIPGQEPKNVKSYNWTSDATVSNGYIHIFERDGAAIHELKGDLVSRIRFPAPFAGIASDPSCTFAYIVSDSSVSRIKVNSGGAEQKRFDGATTTLAFPWIDVCYVGHERLVFACRGLGKHRVTDLVPFSRKWAASGGAMEAIDFAVYTWWTGSLVSLGAIAFPVAANAKKGSGFRNRIAYVPGWNALIVALERGLCIFDVPQR